MSPNNIVSIVKLKILKFSSSKDENLSLQQKLNENLKKFNRELIKILKLLIPFLIFSL